VHGPRVRALLGHHDDDNGEDGYDEYDGGCYGEAPTNAEGQFDIATQNGRGTSHA
jgi:hypothetical protein